MSMEFRTRHLSLDPEHSLNLGGVPEESDQPCANGNVLVTSGIHRGRFPIGGLRIRDVRDALRHLVNIDEGAVAVINGRTVDEDDVVNEDVSHISFVKPSAVKGCCQATAATSRGPLSSVRSSSML